MNTEEYANLERVERDHWYYAGKRAFVRAWIARLRPLRPDDELLDCGAGTGQFAAEMQALCHVRVLDDHDEALRRLSARFPADRVHRLADGRIPLPAACVDIVTALDVLEHIPDDAAAVAEMHRVLRPGGLIVVTVPAGTALWSDWDEALHHQRRYGRRTLGALFPDGRWELAQHNYTNVLAYPAVWMVRRWRRWFPRAPAGEAGASGTAIAAQTERAEDRVPPRALNATLRWLFEREARVRVPFPFGVSLLLVARKR